MPKPKPKKSRQEIDDLEVKHFNSDSSSVIGRQMEAHRRQSQLPAKQLKTSSSRPTLEDKEPQPTEVMSAQVLELDETEVLLHFEDSEGHQRVGWVLRSHIPLALQVEDLLQVRVFRKGQETSFEWRHFSPPKPAAYLDALRSLPEWP
jgi:hypothetical protein